MNSFTFRCIPSNNGIN